MVNLTYKTNRRNCIIFTINAYKFLLGFEDTFRLSKDKTWKQQRNFVLFDPDTDMLFESFASADRWFSPIIRFL
jgi:hypothetical protein